MTSPRRTKRCGIQSAIQNLDWDSPSTKTGTVKRRPTSCPEKACNSRMQTFNIDLEEDSRSSGDSSLAEVEQRIESLINENRPSSTDSESSRVPAIPDDVLVKDVKCKIIKNKPPTGLARFSCKKLKEDEALKLITKGSVHRTLAKEIIAEDGDQMVPGKKKQTSKIKLPFSPAKERSRFKIFNQEAKQKRLSSPVRRTISNEYVKLKFNETLSRRTKDGKTFSKITPKIQSIIPESPEDTNDPSSHLSPNKKYTVTVNNKVRCDKENYVIFDPETGFSPERPSKIPLKSPTSEFCSHLKQSFSANDARSVLSPTRVVISPIVEVRTFLKHSVSVDGVTSLKRLPIKSPLSEKSLLTSISETSAKRTSKIPLKSPSSEKQNFVRHSVSDTDSGISPSSPMDVRDLTVGCSGASRKSAGGRANTLMRRKAAEQLKRTTIPSGFKVPEPYEFYNKATPFVQRTLLFVADETTGPAADDNQMASSSKEEASNTSPKKSFFFSPSKKLGIFRTSPKKTIKQEEVQGTSSRQSSPSRQSTSSSGLISYAPGWSLKGEHLMKWQESGKTTIEIYTDWANHYLERARSRRRAGAGGGLARDCADGLLLADVLEGVTGLKVTRPHRKPRSSLQMLENVQSCLDFLHAQNVQGLEQVTAEDIRDAKLKAVLALFFALSRHKQAGKQKAAPSLNSNANCNNELGDETSQCIQRMTGGASEDILTVCGNNVTMTTISSNRQVSVLQTSIPLPSSAITARRAPPDKQRPLPATPVHNGSKNGLSASSSRSTSPTNQHTFIPRPPTSNSGSRPNSSLIPPGSKIPSIPFNQQQTNVNQNSSQSKQSMLDKLKIFNKDKTGEKQANKTNSVSKRTSSSSGFSSAKSERSDSSLSLNDNANTTNIKPPTTSNNRNVRPQIDSREIKSVNKNCKTKLINSKPMKESPVPLAKSNSKVNCNGRSSPKLSSKEKESRLVTPKVLASSKNSQNDNTKNTKLKSDMRPIYPSGSQSKLNDFKSDKIDSRNIPSSLQTPRLTSGCPNNSNNNQGLVTSPSSTSIPKPTAAVKGTFKVNKEDRFSSKSSNSQLSPIQSNSSLTSLNNSPNFHRESSNLSKENVTQKQTLAVSPMPVNNSQMSDSSHSNSTHSASTGHNSNSSEGSVIYKPSSESGSELSKQMTNGKAVNGDYLAEVINEAENSEKQVSCRQAERRNITPKQNGVNRIIKERSRSNSPSHKRDNSLDEENAAMNVVPMRPLLRGYNSHLTLPMRMVQRPSNGFPHHANTVKANFGRDTCCRPGFANYDYCDVDIASGYMSDGDCLRKVNPIDVQRHPANDIMDGYMSEGGASLYGRKINYNQATQQSDDMRGRGVPSTRVRPANGMDSTTGSGVVYRVVSSRSRSKQDSSQQTENNSAKLRTVSGGPGAETQWKKYTDSPGVGSPAQNSGPPSPSHSRKSDRSRTSGRNSPQQHKKEKLTAAQQLGIAPAKTQLQSPNSGQSTSRPSSAAGIPIASAASNNGTGKLKTSNAPNYGYIKRQNGTTPQTNGTGGRTAQVSAVPRTKVKVSGGTQTCTQDLQLHKNGIGPKSFSLGGSTAAQLSQSVRERLLGSQSLPKPGTHEFQALFQHHRMAARGGMKITDGSLSDTQTYADLKAEYGAPYASWIRHSNTYSATGRLSEGESLESLTSLHIARGQSPNTNHHHRSSLTHGKLIVHHRDPSATAQGNPRLNRSNSIRSTKSEKLYPSMLQRSSESDYEPYYCLPVQYGSPGHGLSYGTSEPPSPSPRSALSPTSHLIPGGTTPRHSHHYAKKNDEAHGSAASLVSSASAMEERQAMEVRKLRRELADAKEKVHTLTTQLTTNAHVVSAFEQSLSNMTQRLQQLTATAERKDSELTELRQTIELLRKQSIQAGLTTAHMQSMGIKTDGLNVSGQVIDQLPPVPPSNTSPQRRQNNKSGSESSASNAHNTTLTNGSGAITRHLSTDSVSSINSLSSGSSAAHDKKHRKKGWLRSSFTKAFSRNAKISKTAKHSSLGQLSSQDSSSGSQHYDDPHTIREGSNENSLEHFQEEDIERKQNGDCGDNAIEKSTTEKDPDLVDELKRQLREKDLVLTDIRLEALSSAHQLESLKDTVVKMRNEMLNLKQNNERLQRLVTSRSLAGSQTSLGTAGSAATGEDPRRFSLADQASNNSHQTVDMHAQSLDFSCLTSTPDFGKKKSPESLYGTKLSCDVSDPDPDPILTALTVNGSDEMFTNERLSGDYDINVVLPPPKSRELAIGESYSDLGLENQGDVSDGKKIAISVYLGQPETFQRYFEEVQDTMSEAEHRYYTQKYEKQTSFESPRLSLNHSPEAEHQEFPHPKSNTNSLKSNKSSRSFKNVFNPEPSSSCNEFIIAYTYISGKTTWQNLDYIVRKTFKDYLSRVDPGTNLGLNTDSITSYHLGEATRGPEISFPELLPCGYIVGTVNALYICLQGVGSLAFDSLIPKNIVNRYVTLLSEHRRVILCGPSGTGKSYLAAKLAEFYVQKTQRRSNPAEAVATFNMERKTAQELRAYLSTVAEASAAETEGGALPAVLVLDNLQNAHALADLPSQLAHPRMPLIIGTMSQATCNTTNLHLNHNFRWLLTSNHMEPVKGFLARYLRRKLFSVELSRARREPALAAVLEWLPGVWAALNAFLEAHASSDVTVGPRLFLACPMDLDSSQTWFADVWNYSVVPYVAEAVREGVALYGRRRGGADPLNHVRATYPWREPNNSHTLRAISLEDIGIEENKLDDAANNQDPLLNMLMRLQEAANYSGNQSQDSDNASIDSNMTHDSSMGNE